MLRTLHLPTHKPVSNYVIQSSWGGGAPSVPRPLARALDTLRPVRRCQDLKPGHRTPRVRRQFGSLRTCGRACARTTDSPAAAAHLHRHWLRMGDTTSGAPYPYSTRSVYFVSSALGHTLSGCSNLATSSPSGSDRTSRARCHPDRPRGALLQSVPTPTCRRVGRDCRRDAGGNAISRPRPATCWRGLLHSPLSSALPLCSLAAPLAHLVRAGIWIWGSKPSQDAAGVSCLQFSRRR